jgi:peptidoglycan hydrolase CwlO-like protein
MTTPRLLHVIERLTSWIGSIASIIVHTCVFATAFFLGFFHAIAWDTILLVLTTVVSLEAIYLAIFIQMTVNHSAQSLRAVEHDVDEIQKDIDAIEHDVDEIQEDEAEEITRDAQHQLALATISSRLQILLDDVQRLKKE